MERGELTKIIDERVSHHLGIMQEWMTDQFKLVFELLGVNKEITDLKFKESEGASNIMKKDIGDVKLDICELQDRVGRLEGVTK